MNGHGGRYFLSKESPVAKASQLLPVLLCPVDIIIHLSVRSVKGLGAYRTVYQAQILFITTGPPWTVENLCLSHSWCQIPAAFPSLQWSW